ncbi:ABC transporter permease [Niveispirillum sp.]|uniref:ABC transporter permease n=1 Tax=Niveispirillum sp. TaxID=1917217 RepID=UPI001B616EB0|nr:ABC transporter permease [Niveispirillum sp.]MBP7338737.1 ABC transporter permease [Niveispirillum sp.]
MSMQQTRGPAGAFNPGISRQVPAFHWVAFLTLCRRELRRMVKMAAAFLIAPALMAAIYFVCFLFGLGGQRGTPEGDAVLSYLVPGLIMLSILLRAAENGGFMLLYSKIEGHIIDELMAPIGAREAVPAYLLAGLVAGMGSGLVVWVASLFFWPLPVAHPVAAIGFALAGALLMALCGLLCGMASTKWDHISAYFTFLFTPLSFLSGLFAPVDKMPESFAALVRLNPLYHAMEGFRHGILGGPMPWGSALFLAIVIVLLYALAAKLYASGWHMKS